MYPYSPGIFKNGYREISDRPWQISYLINRWRINVKGFVRL